MWGSEPAQAQSAQPSLALVARECADDRGVWVPSGADRLVSSQQQCRARFLWSVPKAYTGRRVVQVHVEYGSPILSPGIARQHILDADCRTPVTTIHRSRSDIVQYLAAPGRSDGEVTTPHDYEPGRGREYATHLRQIYPYPVDADSGLTLTRSQFRVMSGTSSAIVNALGFSWPALQAGDDDPKEWEFAVEVEVPEGVDTLFADQHYGCYMTAEGELRYVSYRHTVFFNWHLDASPTPFRTDAMFVARENDDGVASVASRRPPTPTPTPTPPPTGSPPGGFVAPPRTAQPPAESPSVASVFVANGWSSADSAVSALLAARHGDAAVLYVSSRELPQATRAALAAIDPEEVTIVGGTAAIAPEVAAAVEAAAGVAVSRVAGATRFETAVEAAPRVRGATVVVVNGYSPQDQGAAAALAARREHAAVVFTLADVLPDASRHAISDLAPKTVIVVGGEASVSSEVLAAAAAAAAAGAKVQRVAGASRVETAAAAARLGVTVPAPAGTEVVIANGWSAPDIAAAASLAARDAGRTVLVAYAAADSLPAATAGLLGDLRPARVTLIGGTAALSAAVETAARAAAPRADIERIAGVDRIDTAAKIARTAD